MATTTTTTTLASSKRYQRLLQTIEKSLSESRKAFDTSLAVKECYGDDASIFEEGTENTLGELINGMVEGVNDRVKEEMIQEFSKHNVEEKLRIVEDIIQVFDKVDAQEKKQESQDRQSARDALQMTKLPEGVTPQDIVRYHAYAVMKEEKDKLLADLAEVEGEVERMEEQLQKGTEVVEKQMRNLQDVGTELERTADVCSMMA